MATVNVPTSTTVEIAEENCFSIRYNDWRRIRREINDIQKQKKWASNIGFSCLGIASSTAITFISMFNADIINPLIFNTFIMTIIVFSILSVILLYLDWSMGKRTKEDLTNLNKDLDDIKIIDK